MVSRQGLSVLMVRMPVLAVRVALGPGWRQPWDSRRRLGEWRAELGAHPQGVVELAHIRPGLSVLTALLRIQAGSAHGL